MSELAGHLGRSEEEISEGLLAANGYHAGSLDTPGDQGDVGRTGTSGRTFADAIGGADPAMDLVEDFLALAPLLARLDDRERHIIELRFGREMTQAEIGVELGVSQMHVSRLLARTLARLRTGMLADR